MAIIVGMAHTMEYRSNTVTHLSGIWTDGGEIVLTGHVWPNPAEGSVRIRLCYVNHRARWISASVQPGGTFSYTEHAPNGTRVVFIVALFEGNARWLESRSQERKISAPFSQSEAE